MFFQEESIDLSGCINKKKKEEERQYSFEISSIQTNFNKEAWRILFKPECHSFLSTRRKRKSSINPFPSRIDISRVIFSTRFDAKNDLRKFERGSYNARKFIHPSGTSFSPTSLFYIILLDQKSDHIKSHRIG